MFIVRTVLTADNQPVQ